MLNIQQLRIKEFKILKDFEANFNGENILLLGENGIGKSSILQFLRIALGDQSCIPPNAIGSGEVITLKDGKEYTLKVKFNKDGKPVITIIAPDGMKDDRKATLAALFGAIKFDINTFVELSKTKAGRKEQVEIFKGFLPEDVRAEILRLETNVEVKFKERTELNSLIKQEETLIESNPLVRTNLSSYKKVRISDVLKTLEETTKANEAIRDVVKRKNDRAEAIETDKNSIVQLEGNIKKFEEEIEAIKAKIELEKERIKIKNEEIEAKVQQNTAAEEWLKTNTEKDVTAYTQTIENANVANQNRKEAVRLRWRMRKLARLKDDSGDLTVLIETQRQAISDAIKDMSSPIEGLSFDEEQLLYKGIPVNPDSLSTSEIMELGIGLKIAENPDAPLFIECAESIGEDRYKAILETAKKNNRQVFMEQVVRGKKDLVIEIIAE